MKTYMVNMRDSETIEEFMYNAFVVINDFMALVSEYGPIGCINHRAPSDKRFKLTRNGSYYHLADYTFTYGFMHGTDDVYWTCAEFDTHVLVRGLNCTTNGELIVYRYLGYNFI